MNPFDVPIAMRGSPSRLLYQNIGQWATKNIKIADYGIGLPKDSSQTIGDSLFSIIFNYKKSGYYEATIVNTPKTGITRYDGTIQIKNPKIHTRGEWIFLAYKGAFSKILSEYQGQELTIHINTSDNSSWAPALTSDLSHKKNTYSTPLIPTEYDARLRIGFKNLKYNSFDNLLKDEKRNETQEVHRRLWKEKKAILYWRGGANGQKPLQKQNIVGPTFREMICLKYADNPQYDLKITRNFKELKCETAQYELITSEEVANSEFAKYKYFPDLPGSVRGWGGIFRHLQGILVLREESKTKVLAWDDFMKPWVDYIPVENNFNNLELILEWCKHNDEACMEIALNGYFAAIRYIMHSEEIFFKSLVDFTKTNKSHNNLIHIRTGRNYEFIEKLISFQSAPGLISSK